MPWSSTSQKISTTFLLLLLLLSGDVETNPGPATNWAELVINTAGQDVQYGTNDPRPIMTWNNYLKTRMVVVSSKITVDQQLAASLKNNRKTDCVTCLVVEKADYMNSGVFEEDKFRKDITERLRPTVIIMKTTDTDVKQALEGGKKNKDWLINPLHNNQGTTSDPLHAPLTNGDVLYETLNVPLAEPILLTFTVESNGIGIKERVEEMLKRNNVPNASTTRLLFVSGTHGGTKKNSQGEVLPMDGPSGLTYPSFLDHDFYMDDSANTIGLIPSPMPHHKDANGYFDSWMYPPPLHRPDINTILRQTPLPPDCLLNNPAYENMQMQCVSVADYYNKQDLRGTDRQAVNKRMQEFADDVVRFQPTHIFICWCYSANNDLSLALRGSGVFATMMLAHDLKEITGDPSAKLHPTQEEVLREINRDQVRHVILAGSPGAGKTIIGCEGIKMWAARLTREQDPPTVNIYVVNMLCDGELFNVIRKSFAGLAFNIRYVTGLQLCSDEHFNVTMEEYADPDNKKWDMVGLINAVTKKSEARNVAAGGATKSLSLFLFDETKNYYNNIDNYSGLSDLQQLTTVRCCICINPGTTDSATTAASFTYTFPPPPPTSSIYSRHLRVTYRNSRHIGDFCTFLRDHDTMPGPSTASDTPGDSLPEGPPVTWIHCLREEDLAAAVKQAVEKMKTATGSSSSGCLVLYNGYSSDRGVSKKAAKDSGAEKVMNYQEFFGCEEKHIVVVTNSGLWPEAVSRARNSLCVVTGPGLTPRNNYLLLRAAETVHGYDGQGKSYRNTVGGSYSVKCPNDCHWVGEQFPLVNKTVYWPYSSISLD